ncbi:MAG: hypothetical protein UX94_C0006G0014 [Parcubacteria group bacterium GW2011_GWA2_47_21]|nr:MAG: hypothetical protein UX94_C0006G0014 [Parcubacteria group bacterium GW2011_GWA2_47_21]
MYDPIGGSKFLYPVLGLAGESGELLNKVKKIFRDKAGKIDAETKESVISELGDVLWYVAQIATEFETPLADVAKCNLEKLKSRAHRGKIGGEGDKR